MLLPDVNILIYAFRENAPEHAAYRNWLEEVFASETSFGLCDPVVSGFLRIITNPRLFDPPVPLENAIEFIEALRAQPNCVIIAPGRRHWAIFTRLCRDANATGNLISDAYLAALAIESGSDLISTDRDFGLFPGLRWRRPF